MLYPFFALAAVSPGRQCAFRRAVVVHLCLLCGGAWAMAHQAPAKAAPLLGHLLLVAGIVEGAALVGWRLTQLPRSQALEFLFASPLRPGNVFVGEALVGVARLALVTLAGVPVLALLSAVGYLEPLDLVPLLVMPFTWGALTGLGLTVWAYEPIGVRRTGERVALGLVVVYLGVGVLAGEHLRRWIALLPDGAGKALLSGFAAFHRYNPFAVLSDWLTGGSALYWERAVGLEAAALAVLGLLLTRAALRMQGHYHDRHYRPAVDRSASARPRVGDRPLAWWAVKRVTEYSGRINFWMAGGFGAVYALYTLAGPHWPVWLGRQVFVICDRAGGIPALATGLVVLAAVPAAFQYGLWDSSAQDRCRRLELLLLTRLGPRDYWDAAAAAAWRRGRGYFGVAVLLWLAAVLAGQVGVLSALAAIAAGVLLWAMYFTLGFRAFTRGLQANGLGMLLTLGLPLLAFVGFQLGWPQLAALAPPGGVYGAAAGLAPLDWLPGALLAGGVALAIARHALAHCDGELRRWYEQHHGRKILT